MADATPNTRDYVLGSSAHERERLKLQASIVGRWTEKYLLAAGLDRGMHVLDLGCGMGDVSLLAAEIVGPSGSVIAIDRDPATIEKARERASSQGHSAPLQPVHSELLQFQADKPFDAVIGRYFLLYQPDPAKALLHVINMLRAGGILCFHEMAFGSPAGSYPEGTLFSKMLTLIAEVFRRSGINPDMGLILARVFAEAGLSRPTIHADVPVGGEAGSYLYTWGAETVKALLPRIEQLGLASAHELQLDTLARRMEDEALHANSVLLGPTQFGAWTVKA